MLCSVTVNESGTACPHALKLVACHLLLEITAFLRETYNYLPRPKVTQQHANKEPSIDRHLSSRRWSSALGSPGHSERSNSRSSSQGQSS